MPSLNDLRDRLMHHEAFRDSYDQRSQLVRIGHMLRRAREAQELTQSQLADRLHTTQSEICKLEKGEGMHGPTFGRMVSVAHALGLSLVVGLTEEQPKQGLQSDHPPKMLRVRRKRSERAPAAGANDRRVVEAAEDHEALWSAF